jgi:hypothetical protein
MSCIASFRIITHTLTLSAAGYSIVPGKVEAQALNVVLCKQLTTKK